MYDLIRTVYTFKGGYKISVVHMQPGEEYAYEAYLIDGDRDKARALGNQYNFLSDWPLPVDDAYRYTSERLAECIQHWCYYIGLVNVEMS